MLVKKILRYLVSATALDIFTSRVAATSACTRSQSDLENHGPHVNEFVPTSSLMTPSWRAAEASVSPFGRLREDQSYQNQIHHSECMTRGGVAHSEIGIVGR